MSDFVIANFHRTGRRHRQLLHLPLVKAVSDIIATLTLLSIWNELSRMKLTLTPWLVLSPL